MLLTKEVEVTLQGRHINYYKNKGYDVDVLKHKKRNTIPVGTKILVKIKDLNPTSHMFVEVKCDYCGKVIQKQYTDYLAQRSKNNLNKDACSDCRNIKQTEMFMLNYNGKVRPHQKDIEFINKEFEKRDCILITDKYINNKNKLEFLCLKHQEKGVQTTTWGSFSKSDYSCKYCGMESRIENTRKDLNIVRKRFEELNLIPLNLEEEYINKDSKLSYICNIHNDKIQYGTWSSMKKNGLCYECGIAKNTGENHSRWNGGVSSLLQFTRAKILDWKYDTMRLFDYKCGITGLGGFEIHHLYPFKDIFDEMIKLSGLDIRPEVSMYSESELKIFEKIIQELHIKYGLGILVKEELHILFHSNYGYSNNTHLQFKQFIQRLQSGEFDEYLSEHNLTLNLNYEALNKLALL